MKHFTTIIFFVIISISYQASAVPLIFTDRSAWESNINGQIYTEDFESDPVSYNPVSMPYATASGVTMNWVNPQYGSLQIFPGGYNGSQVAHFRDFGDMLSIAFPNSMTANAFGFEYWYHDPEVWQLNVNGLVIALTPYEMNNYQPSFIGIVDTSSLISSFILTSPSYAQGGLSIDNLSYSPVPEPSTMLLLGSGLAGLGIFRKRFKKNKRPIEKIV